MQLKGQERILILKPSSLGDIVHTLPAVAAIKSAFPDTQIDWLANTEWAPILEGSPALHRVIPFPRREFRGIGGLLKARNWAKSALTETSYDLTLDFQGLLRSALLARFSNAPERIGFAEAREGAAFFYTKKIAVADWNERHAIDRYLAFPKALGIDIQDTSCPLPPGTPVSGISTDTPSLLLHPFSRGPGKSLSTTEVNELCEALRPLPIWLAGKCDDATAAYAWPDNVTHFLNQTDLSQLIYLIRSAAWTISVDSGPMHLAAGLSDRVLSIHTWTDPLMVGPWHPTAWVWIDHHIRQISSIDAGEFPERREHRKRFAHADRILSPGDISALAEFIHSQFPA